MLNSLLLANLGITEKSAEVYFATLTLGTASIQEIAAHAGLKRPTVYLHVDDLLRQGLLEKVPLGKKDYYKAADPAVLELRAQDQLALIQAARPDLERLQKTTLGRPDIVVLEGAKALGRVYDEICQANSIRFWSNLATFENIFEGYFEKISGSIRLNQITTREIITNTPEARKSARRYAQAAGKSYSARISTKDGIQNDNAIYGNVVALFRIHAYNLYVVRIEDQIIADSMKAIFDMAWESAKPLREGK